MMQPWIGKERYGHWSGVLAALQDLLLHSDPTVVRFMSC